MGELIGEGYGDDQDPAAEEGTADEVERARSEIRGGTGPGEGRLDKPATTGTHRGWGDPQAGEGRES
ncbi:MAG: hypothetical protein V7644_1533 [Actinomycetota bacterium]|jgi:hypothetical protein